MAGLFNMGQHFPRSHRLVATGPSPYGPCMVYCQADGTIEVTDEDGVTLQYTLTAGSFVPVLVHTVGAVSGTFYYTFR